MKKCCKCNQFKPLSDFGKNKPTKDGLNKRCKPCHKEASNKSYKRDIETHKKRMRLQGIRMYWPDLSLKDAIKAYEDLKASQNNTCPICLNNLDASEKRAHIDHDHKTGQVRGILCNNCNRGIGYLKDNTESLDRAKAYLLKFKL